MPMLGKLLRRFRAGAERSPLADPQYASTVNLAAIAGPVVARGTVTGTFER